VNESASPTPPSERRAGNRRSGTDRRGNQRRFVIDRRFSNDGHTPSGTWLAAEPPAEHVRNAMQLIMHGLESETPLTVAEFSRLAESALARLSLALADMEGDRRA
jgi:hypothetical protein